jgi:hypothetical protein
LTKQKNLCDKKSSQTKVVVHKKFTTKLSTTFSSKKLHCVGDELSIKKMWSGGTKTGWIATPNTPTTTAFPILSTNNRSVQKTNVRSCPTLCSYPYVVLKKTRIVYAKKAHYLRILGAKKRMPWLLLSSMSSILYAYLSVHHTLST